MRAVCDIIPQKKETHRTRLTAGVNIIDCPGEVSTPPSWNSMLTAPYKMSNQDTCAWPWRTFTWTTWWIGQNISWYIYPWYQSKCWTNTISRYIAQWIHLRAGNQVNVWTPSRLTDSTLCCSKKPGALWIPPLKQKPRTMDTQQSINQLHIGSWWLWGKIFGEIA